MAEPQTPPERQPAADGGGTAPPLLVRRAVEDLCALSGALSDFVRQWNALHDSLHSIQTSIDSRSVNLDAVPMNDVAVHVREDDKPELDLICETMAGRPLRKYITDHLADPARLRSSVPAAIRRAPSPPRLVLDAIGRFYLQGSRAYICDSRAGPNRQACVLLLELFLLSGCPDSSPPDTSVAEDARVAALAWRNRIVCEGGVRSAGPADAHGLVLFLATFGIPREVSSRELCDLLRRLDGLKEKAEVLHNSPVLMGKMSDIIKDMISKEMHVEAVDFISAFGLEKNFPPIPLLLSFLSKCLQPLKEKRREGQYSHRVEETANRKQLAMLKSVIKCMEDNKLDLSKLASFKIEQKIVILVKAISKGGEKRKAESLKRKAVEIRPLNKSEAHARYLLSGSADASHRTLLQLNSQEHGTAVLSNVQDHYNGLPPQNMPVGGLNGLINESGGMGVTPAAVHGTSAPVAAGYGGSLPNSGGVYGWYGNEAFTDASTRYNLLRMPTSSGQGVSGLPMGNGLMDSSRTAEHNLYQPPPSFPHGMGSRSSGSKLYQFADDVQEQDSYHGQPITSRVVNNHGYHHASYLS